MNSKELFSSCRKSPLDILLTVETSGRYSRYFALEYAGDSKINRFPKLKEGDNPYDTDWLLYFEERETDKMSVTVKGNQTLRKLFYQQEGKWALCAIL